MKKEPWIVLAIHGSFPIFTALNIKNRKIK
jgi:hypothetical protein